MIRFVILLAIAALLPSGARAGAPPVRFDPGSHAWELMQFGKSYLRIQPPSQETAIRYFERAAASGVPWVMYDVAELYRKGELVPKNPARAFDLYGQVISHEDCTPTSQTCAWAKFQVGEMLRKGEGTKRNLVQARRFLEEAVQVTGNEWPKLALAEVLAASKGQDDTYRALALYRESAAVGNVYAAEGLATLCGRLSLAQC